MYRYEAESCKELYLLSGSPYIGIKLPAYLLVDNVGNVIVYRK